MGTPMETAHQGLSVKQELALELILCGINDGDIAKRAGVSCQTINTWRNHNQIFRMLLACRREVARERLSINQKEGKLIFLKYSHL